MERATPVSVQLTENFERNLMAIASFLGKVEEGLQEAEASAVYERLLDRLEFDVLSTLERFPRIGRRFLDRRADSAEATSRIERLQQKLVANTAEVYEYLFDDYLILYLLTDTTLYLASIRHHRQLSFDLKLFW